MADRKDMLKDMRRTLLSEFGARAIYSQLAFFSRDSDLSSALLEFKNDEELQIEGLRGLLEANGQRARRGSFRRTTLAGCLALFGAVFGLRTALRICADAERMGARWYATYQSYFQREGDLESARICSRLGMTKHRHAEVLQTWVQNAPRRLTKG